MSKTWKHVSGALGAMIFGSLVTGVVMTSPTFLRNDPVAQEPVMRQSAETLIAQRENQNMLQEFGNSDARPLGGQNLAAAEGLSTAFRNVANFVRASVVSINTKQTRVIGGRQLPPGFQDFFNIPEIQPRQRQETGMGSGVVVRRDGYILTNNHVIEGADELEIEFSDGRKAAGRIVGTDPQTDLAVVKVDREDLTAIPIGDSERIQVGDWVIAIGSPFGLDQTVTAGIISGKNRVRGIVDDGDGFEDFLQTDAAINPGNSGGPLVNLRGELVGINTAIMSRSGSSAGIGFAIPVSLAGPVLNSIIEHGVVRRGFLGASLTDVNEKTIEGFNLKSRRGVMIQSVLDGMPAAEAGLEPRDVVTAIDGRPMLSSSQMKNYVASRPPGASMAMTVDRNGQPLQVQVDLKERTDELMAQFAAGEVLGAKVVPATESIAKKYNYTNLQGGLIITEIEADSVAEQAGLMVGDVIETAGRYQLESARELEMIVGEYERAGEPLRITIRRGQRRMLGVVQP
ncbi:Do family serine endopeptidase [Roseiconus lacunae]|uniref:Do family serine endopeptidase n=1 Tax=Roseiconus lacunae TaxID=2605694 RepID=UPI003089A23B|nr:Do family serine endopeptidase [Stieleria sp. HD01]